MPKLLIPLELKKGENVYKLISQCRTAMLRTGTYEKYWVEFHREATKTATYALACTVITAWFEVTWV